MPRRIFTLLRLMLATFAFIAITAHGETLHPWLPPFGLERIGHSPTGPDFEADAEARPETEVNPVNLGAILVPQNWLLLGPKQKAWVDVAAIDRTQDEPQLRVNAWFASRPHKRAGETLALTRNVRAQQRLNLPAIPDNLDRDELLVTIERADGTRLWQKTIPVMLVREKPNWPAFGAVTTKLRYDAPISVRHDDGTFSALDYAGAWKPELKDVVVCLPNGARFVFWRGSCYVPFWAGTHNTGFTYEWAETRPPADGFKDCVEPLMDKELRYGRVEVMESTASRVQVRWTYQSCDFNYKVWGDAVQEDFYFYPDGFGTRVLTLQSALDSSYELSEFIILTPAEAYPFNVLPRNLVDILFLDGEKRELQFPYLASEQGAKMKSRDMAAIYRVRLHKDEPASAIYFHPEDRKLPPMIYSAFTDAGQVVTPCYWGSHWPLSRGQTTGGAINDRIHTAPAHNSVMTWAMQSPPPLRETRLKTLDTLGRMKPMQIQTWDWLIGYTEANDARLLEWAESFAKPPTLEVTGARLEAESYAPERRALRLVAEGPTIKLKLHPSGVCVNPVFEIRNAPPKIKKVTINGKTLSIKKWSWDGKTLWLESTFREATEVGVEFGAGERLMGYS